MQTTAAYYLTQKSTTQRVKSSMIVMAVLSAVCIAFIVNRMLNEQLWWAGNIFYSLLIIWFIISPVYSYRKLSKQAKFTKLEINDTDVTLTVPSRPALNLNFTDIKLVNKTDHGLVLVPVSKAQKVMMITKNFEGFGEITTAIEKHLSPDQVKGMSF